MQEIFKFKDNKTFFGLTIYKTGVKLSVIETLPFSKFFIDSRVGSTMALVEDENYIYIHDWENFCKSFIQYGTRDIS